MDFKNLTFNFAIYSNNVIFGFLVGIVLPVLQMYSSPFDVGPSMFDITSCNTTAGYDNKTRASVFGDSRIMYTSVILAPQHLDTYLGASDEGWNVQNFGIAGQKSTELLSRLKVCLKNPNFKIHQNISFHIGGNDFREGHIRNLVQLQPWKFPSVVRDIADNNERILSLFQRRGKKVILHGHYPAISRSWKNRPNIGFSSSVTDFLYWSMYFAQDSATVASYGLMLLEPKIVEMYQRRSAFMNINHVHIWSSFLYPGHLDEPYRGNPLLMLPDHIHPNPAGMAVWGKLVGDKMRALGWTSDTYDMNRACTKGTNCPEDIDDTTPQAGDSTNDPPPACDALCIAAICFFTGKCW